MARGWDHPETSSPTRVVPVMTQRLGISGTVDQAPKCGHCYNMGFPTTWRLGVPSVSVVAEKAEATQPQKSHRVTSAVLC